MNTSPVRVGIIGLGPSGWSIHALGLQQMPERFQVVAVAGLIAARRAEAQQTFGAIAEYDLRTPGCSVIDSTSRMAWSVVSSPLCLQNKLDYNGTVAEREGSPCPYSFRLCPISDLKNRPWLR